MSRGIDADFHCQGGDCGTSQTAGAEKRMETGHDRPTVTLLDRDRLRIHRDIDSAVRGPQKGKGEREDWQARREDRQRRGKQKREYCRSRRPAAPETGGQKSAMP